LPKTIEKQEEINFSPTKLIFTNIFSQHRFSEIEESYTRIKNIIETLLRHNGIDVYELVWIYHTSMNSNLKIKMHQKLKYRIIKLHSN